MEQQQQQQDQQSSFYYYPAAAASDDMTASTEDESSSSSIASSSQQYTMMLEQRYQRPKKPSCTLSSAYVVSYKQYQQLQQQQTNSRIPPTPSWHAMYQRLVHYRHHYGDCLVTRGYKHDPQLGKWVSQQRLQYSSMLDEKRQLLNEIGFCWKVREARVGPPWEEMFVQLQAYKQRHGHLRFSRTSCQTTQDKKLLFWVENQRRRLAKADADCERRRLFLEIGALTDRNAASSVLMPSSHYPYHNKTMMTTTNYPQVSPELSSSSSLHSDPLVLPPLYVPSKPPAPIPDLDLWRLQHGIPKPPQDHLYVPTLFVNMYAGAESIHKHLWRMHTEHERDE